LNDKTSDNKNPSYQAAGVDIAAANELVERIKPLASATHNSNVLAGIGGFGALYELPKYKQPVLVSSTDGVGTKLKLAIELNIYNSIGIDLVAMCVNDLIVCGAEPLFFLDYYATGKLDVDAGEQIISGIAEGCKLAECALVGGETAEMPGLYQGKDFDLAGFSVGVVEKDQIIDGSGVSAGDKLIGLASSGVHSNGFSLVRKIIETTGADLNADDLGKKLLTPTRIYVKTIKALIKETKVNAIAHITGGGLTENIPRVLPKQFKAVLNNDSWEQPEIFDWIRKNSELSEDEMFRTFNCGIGMVVCVPKDSSGDAMKILQDQGETVWEIGEIATRDD